MSGEMKVIKNNAGNYVRLHSETKNAGVDGYKFKTRVAEEYKDGKLIKESVWSQPSGTIQTTFVPKEPGSKEGVKYVYDSSGKNPSKNYMY